MVKTKRKKAKRKYKRKARGLTQKQIENLNSTLKKSLKSLKTLSLSKNINTLPGDVIEQINSNVRMDNLHKKYFIDFIKEICYNRIYLFFNTMKQLTNIFLDTNLERDIATHIQINCKSTPFSILQFLENYNNFKKEKEITFIPLFNKFDKEVEPKRSRNSELEENYAAPRSVEDKEFTKILNMFTLKELKLIFLLFEDYVVYGEFPTLNERPYIGQWIDLKFGREDYQRVLNS
tara:strand:- start:1387 stop:2088 length:702 start_codon:yes stop_codon:yes gene_type:complete